VVGSRGHTQRVSFGRNPPEDEAEIEAQAESE
jgi:hypothetical protein